MKEYDRFRRDNCIINIIKEHRGRHNAISEKEIRKLLSEKGWSILHPREIINRVKMERNIPICGNKQYGYYWAADREDIQASIDYLEARVASLNEHINWLKSFIIK